MIGMIGIAGGVGSADAAVPTATAPICAAVTAASISKVVGYAVPAASSLKDTSIIDKKDGISATAVDCTYGKETSTASIAKAVTLTYEQLSKRLSSSEIKQDLLNAQKQAVGGATLKTASYSGLGVPAFTISTADGGIELNFLLAINGTKIVGAEISQKTSTATLAALTKLALKVD
jgi:hypothetical protein